MSDLQLVLREKMRWRPPGTVLATLTVCCLDSCTAFSSLLRVERVQLPSLKLIHIKLCIHIKVLPYRQKRGYLLLYLCLKDFLILCPPFLATLNSVSIHSLRLSPLTSAAGAALSEWHTFLRCGWGTISADIIHSLLMSITWLWPGANGVLMANHSSNLLWEPLLRPYGFCGRVGLAFPSLCCWDLNGCAG